MKGRTRTLAGVAIAAALGVAPAAGQGLAVQAFAGSQGLGAGVAVGLTPRIIARGSYGVIPGEPEVTTEEVDFRLDPPSIMRATLDFYPTGFFFLSAGGLFIGNGGDIPVRGEVTGSVEFDGNTYSAAEVGTLTGAFGFRGAMPYVGIGFGNPLGRRVGLLFDLGVGIGAVPTVSVDGDGTLAGDPGFEAALRAEEAAFAAGIPDWVKYYPIVSLSLSIGLGG